MWVVFNLMSYQCVLFILTYNIVFLVPAVPPRTLDVGGSNMTFGGVRSIESVLLRPGQVQTHDFVGCVRNMKVNGIPLGLTKALAAYNFLERYELRFISSVRPK